jgi:putative transposase
MSSKYKFKNPDGLYFITYTVINWADVFTRNSYKDLMIESFIYCQKEKGLAIHAYVIMTNHIHMIITRKGTNELSAILRDLKNLHPLARVFRLVPH